MGDPIIKKPVVFFGEDSPFTMDTSIDQRAIPQPAVPVVDAVDAPEAEQQPGDGQQQPDPAKDSGGSSGVDTTSSATITTPAAPDGTPPSGGTPAKP